MPYLYAVLAIAATVAAVYFTRRWWGFWVGALALIAGCHRAVRTEVVECGGDMRASIDIGSAQPDAWADTTAFVIEADPNGGSEKHAVEVPVEFSGSVATAICPSGAPSVIFVIED